MNSIEPMKSVTLVLDIPELSDTLVRTGVPSDGSCFFHAYLLATNKTHRSLSTTEQYQKVVELRRSISEFVTWELLGDIEIVETERVLAETIRKLYRSTEWENVDKDVWAILDQIIPMEELEKAILPLDNTTTQRLSDLVEKSVNTLITGKETAEDIIVLENLKKIAMEFFDALREYASIEALEKFKKVLADPSAQTDDKMLVAIREFSEYDFIFLNGNTRQRYTTGVSIGGKRPILIFIWINECHYENVGRLLAGNRIQRVFTPTDELINILGDN